MRTHIYTYTLIFIVIVIIHFKTILSIIYTYIYEHNSNKEIHQFDSVREHVRDLMNGCWEWPVVGKGGRK